MGGMTKTIEFSMVAAYTKDGRVLGSPDARFGLPWGDEPKGSTSGDMAHFVEISSGNTMIVGANTAPGLDRLHGTRERRLMVVASPDRPIQTRGEVASSVAEAIERVAGDPGFYGKPIVAGGARTYLEAMEYARQRAQQGMGVRATFYATEFHKNYPGSILMPDLLEGWMETDGLRTHHGPDIEGGPEYDFVTFEYN